MSTKKKISFIGSGNVSWHFAQIFFRLGYPIEEIYSRTLSNAKLLTTKIASSRPKTDLDFRKSSSKIFIVAVSDDAIQFVVNNILLPKEAILVHTSGTIDMKIFKNTGIRQYGVFYPLQSFSKFHELSKNVDFPICIEGSTNKVENILYRIGNLLSNDVRKVSSKDRKLIHLSAVFANNFTNHCFMIAKKILDEENIAFDLLKPLIEQSIKKMFVLGPEASQTGPAKRHDQQTINAHKAYLMRKGNYHELYQKISESISSYYLLT